MGTGFNIGGGIISETDDDYDSDNSDDNSSGFGESGSFHVSFFRS